MRKLFVTCAGLLATAHIARAVIVGPYSVDPNTLHLYHLDEAAAPAIDAVTTNGNNLLGLLNGATLNNASFSGFGTALSTIDGGQNNTNTTAKDAELDVSANGSTAVSMKYMNSGTAAFTYEALVHIDFDPTANLGTIANGGNGRNGDLAILMGDSNTASNRVFQFRIEPIGMSSPINLSGPNLSFINVNTNGTAQTMLMALPMSGPDAIAMNNWYHVAVTYNGSPNTSNNISFYWTLLSATRTNASLLGSTNMSNNLPLANISFDIGNISRGSNFNFLGLIDEVRLSDIARPAGQMMFAPATAAIYYQPTNLVVGPGQSATFNVAATGQQPISYQWRFNSNVISGATGTSYTIASCQLSNAGYYDVIVSNSVTPTISAEALLTIHTPLSLTWLGTASSNWDNAVATNWLDTGHSTNAIFTPGDNVTFDANGSAVPSVALIGALTPNSITVNANNNYALVGGVLNGIGSLSKSGSGTLTLDTDVNLSGPVSIQGGVIQLGQNDTHGSLGSGTITNNGGIIISRTSAVSFNSISGSGGLTNIGNTTITLAGTNTFTGPLIASAGGFLLNGTPALGNVTNIALTASLSTAGATVVTLTSNVVVNSNVTIQALNTSASPDDRVSVNATSGTNSVNGPIVMTGNGNVQLTASGTAELDLNAPTVSPGFTGTYVIRGTSKVVVNAPVTIGGGLSTTDAGNWTFNATGNSWTNTRVAGGVLHLGAAGVLPAGVPLTVASAGTLDLAGFNQQAASLSDGVTATGKIGSSSSNSDCVLTITGIGTFTNNGLIVDSLSGGTRKVGLSLIGGGGSLTMTNTNTYSGPTVITGVALILAGSGGISNSTDISVTAGGAINASTRSDSAFTLFPSQTLHGDGIITVQGNFTSHGTVQLKLNKNGAVLTNDEIEHSVTITYGGTLALVISGNPLGTNDSFKLFSALGYSHTFGNITPATPGPGLAWNTNTLASDGTLRITAATALPPEFTGVRFSGGNLIFSGTNGSPGAQFEIFAATNASTPLSNWVSIVSGNYDGTGAFSVTNGITPGTPREFFIIRVP